ncbi:MAG: hypothetical protein IPK03_06200 [Bacteroidetes bacterium]|nr:hypothetical protein [Bacteroidota bacterium]
MDRQFSNFKAVEILQMMDAEERALAKKYIHQFTARKQIRDLYDIIEKKLDLLYIDKKQVIKVLKLESSTASDLMNKLHAELRTFIERHLHHHREFSLSQVQNAFHFYAQKQAIHYVRELVETHDMERRADVAVYPLEHLDWYLLMKSKEVFERNTTHRPAELQPIQYVKNLDVFYWGERILAAIEDINRHAIYNIPYDNQNVQEIINYIEKNLSDQDLLCMYAWIGKLLALSYPFDQGTYNKYIAIIERLPENEYAEETIRSITYLLSNILNRNRAVLGEDFPRLYIELVEIMAHRGVLILEEKYIQLSIFKNVIQLALYDGRLEWADAFFKRYKSYLPGEASRLFISLHIDRAHGCERIT